MSSSGAHSIRCAGSRRSEFIPNLVRYPPAAGIELVKLTPRERKLYVALAIILSLNLSVLCGALTFFGLLLSP